MCWKLKVGAPVVAFENRRSVLYCVPYRAAVLQGPEELFETVSQALLSGQDRDCLAGWGAVVYVM